MDISRGASANTRLSAVHIPYVDLDCVYHLSQIIRGLLEKYPSVFFYANT